MNVKYTSGLVLLLVGILGTPLAVLFYREQSSATNPPTPQIRLLDSLLTISVPEAILLAPHIQLHLQQAQQAYS